MGNRHISQYFLGNSRFSRSMFRGVAVVQIAFLLCVGGAQFVFAQAATENDSDNAPTPTPTPTPQPVVPEPLRNIEGPTRAFSPHIVIEKTVSSTEPLMAPATVDYRIVIRNDGFGPVYGAVLTDVFQDMNGRVAKRQSWNLGEISAGGEITVADTAVFGIDAAGVYANTTELTGFKSFPAPVGDDVRASIVNQRITVVLPKLPEGWSFRAVTGEPEDLGMGIEELDGSGSEAAETPATVAQSVSGANAPAPSPSPVVPKNTPTVPVLETEGSAEPVPREIGAPVAPHAFVALADARPPDVNGNVQPTFLAAIAYAGYEVALLGALAILGGIALFIVRIVH